MNTADTYYIKALDNYPCNLEEAMEAISYGLAHSGDHPALLCLMGQVYAEQLHQYPEALGCFEEALASNLDYPETYYHYIGLLIAIGKFSEAEKLSEQALKVKGIDKYSIYWLKAILLEYSEKYQEAIDMLAIARKQAYNKRAFDSIDDEVSRIEKKLNPDKDKEEEKENEKEKGWFNRLFRRKNKKN